MKGVPGYWSGHRDISLATLVAYRHSEQEVQGSIPGARSQLCYNRARNGTTEDRPLMPWNMDMGLVWISTLEWLRLPVGTVVRTQQSWMPCSGTSTDLSGGVCSRVYERRAWLLVWPSRYLFGDIGSVQAQ